MKTNLLRPGFASVSVALGLAMLASTVGGADLSIADAAAPSMEVVRRSAEIGSSPPAEHVVLITIDGVRWQDVFVGPDPALLAAEPQSRSPRAERWRGLSAAELLPSLHALSQSDGAWVGASADAPLLASGPNFVSLPGYLELVTGRTQHACRSNQCELSGVRTLFDEWREQRPGDRRAVFTSWDGLGQIFSPAPRLAGLTGKASAFRAQEQGSLPGPLTRALERHEKMGASPGHGDYLPDAVTAEVAERYLREYRPNLLMISLGDTDECAHDGNYTGYLDALHESDRVIGRVAALLKTWEELGSSVSLWVSSDHGRERSFRGHGAFAPESARSWLLAAGTTIRARGFAPSQKPRRLADIAPTVRHLAGLPPAVSADAGQLLDELL